MSTGTKELSSLRVLLGLAGYKRVEFGSFVGFRWVQTNCRV